jgi:hypothetical protein
VTTIRGNLLCQSEGNIFVVLFIQISLVILLLLSPIFVFALASHASFNDILVSSDSFPPDDKHVPTFYVPKHHYSEWYHTLLLMGLAAIFGAIHCSGWNYPFPTYREQKLWHVAALAVTIIPIVMYPITVLISSIARRRLPTFDSPTINDRPGALTSFLLMVVYVSARFVLLGLALSLLRHLPSTAYIAIDWTKLYPHIL